jgi:hypothetical protein
MLIFAGLIVVIGSAVALVQYNKSTRYQLTQAIAKMEIDSAVMSVHGGIRAALTEFPAAGCLPSAMDPAKVKSYRRFEDNAALIEFSLNEAQMKSEKMSCLLSPEQIERLSSLKVKIMQLQSTNAGMLRKVEVVVEVTTKAKNEKFIRRAKLARTYQLQPLSVSRFGLMFTSDIGDGSFVDLTGEQTKLRVFSNVLYAGRNRPTWMQLLASNPERLMFERNNFARFTEVNTLGNENMNSFRLTFRNGLQTGALADTFVDQYLPNGSANWQQRFDYYPQYHSQAYPIPELSGRVTAPFCGADVDTFDASRAAINTVPSGDQGPEKASQTCESGANHLAFVFINSAQDLTIKLKSDDRNFCGMVVANTLTVEIDAADPMVYGLIGNFFVKHLRIVNKQALSSGVSEVRIYNPGDGIAFDGLAPIDQSAAEISNHFRQLASSTARNFFLPIAQSSAFTLWNAEGYLRSCPDQPSLYAYRSEYKPFSELPEFSRYQRDEVGSLYALESF